MAYDSPRSTFSAFGDEPVYRPEYSPGSYPVGEDRGADATLGLVDPPEADVVERSPAVTVVRRSRDRFGVHLGWELFLLLTVAGLGFLIYREEPGIIRGARLSTFYLTAAVLGFSAVGLALSLRAAAPNLAIGTIAYAAGMFFADNSDRGLLPTAGVTVLLALAVGVAMAVVVTAFHVPAWAVSLATGFGLLVWIQEHRTGVDVVAGAYQPTEHAVVWFGGFIALSVIGGGLGLVPSLRRRVGGYRPLDDPALRAGGAGAAVFGLVGSSLFAAISGVLLALYNREISPTESGLGLTGLALGAALLGGTSVFGRRGGLFGTALAVLALTGLLTYAKLRGYTVLPLGLGAAAIGVGLLVTRLTETLGGGQPLPPEAPATPWDPPPPPPADSGWNTVSPSGPARAPDPYDDRWGSN